MSVLRDYDSYGLGVYGPVYVGEFREVDCSWTKLRVTIDLCEGYGDGGTNTRVGWTPDPNETSGSYNELG